MCDFDEHHYPCGHVAYQLLCYCHFTRNDPLHQCYSVKAVKARDHKPLNADIEEGHLSSAYCHLGNIAYRLGRKLHINPSSESFVNDSEADAMLTREYRPGFVVPAKV